MVLNHQIGVRFPVPLPAFARLNRERASDGKPARSHHKQAKVDRHALRDECERRSSYTFAGVPRWQFCDAIPLTIAIQVKNGRLLLDEPTDLPDGAEVDVLVIDDELAAEERAELHASLDRALEDSDAGRGMDVWEYLERYRADRESRPTR